MASEFFSSLKFQGGFINGMLGGKLLNCIVQPPLPGSAPVAGLYQIQPPVNDPVFGLLAVMTPVGKPDGTIVGRQKPDGTIVGRQKPDGTIVGAIGASTSFVLSKSPIPGRNCLVIQSGFADLMDALAAAGGVTVRFS